MQAQISARKSFMKLERVYRSCEMALARESERRYHQLSYAMSTRAEDAAGQNAGAETELLPGSLQATRGRRIRPDANLCDVIESMFDHVRFSPFEKHSAYIGLSTPKNCDYKEYNILEGKQDPPDTADIAHGDVLVSTAEIGADLFSATPELECLRNPFMSIDDIDDEEYEEVISGHPDRRKSKAREAIPPSPPVANPFYPSGEPTPAFGGPDSQRDSVFLTAPATLY